MELLTVAQAAKLLPDVSPGTVWRWCRRGLKGRNGPVKLRHLRVGGKLCTRQEWINDFMERCSSECGPDYDGGAGVAARKPDSPTPPRPISENVERGLEEAGL